MLIGLLRPADAEVPTTTVATLIADFECNLVVQCERSQRFQHHFVSFSNVCNTALENNSLCTFAYQNAWPVRH